MNIASYILHPWITVFHDMQPNSHCTPWRPAMCTPSNHDHTPSIHDHPWSSLIPVLLFNARPPFIKFFWFLLPDDGLFSLFCFVSLIHLSSLQRSKFRPKLLLFQEITTKKIVHFRARHKTGSNQSGFNSKTAPPLTAVMILMGRPWWTPGELLRFASFQYKVSEWVLRG